MKNGIEMTGWMTEEDMALALQQAIEARGSEVIAEQLKRSY